MYRESDIVRLECIGRDRGRKTCQVPSSIDSTVIAHDPDVRHLAYTYACTLTGGICIHTNRARCTKPCNCVIDKLSDVITDMRHAGFRQALNEFGVGNCGQIWL